MMPSSPQITTLHRWLLCLPLKAAGQQQSAVEDLKRRGSRAEGEEAVTWHTATLQRNATKDRTQQMDRKGRQTNPSCKKAWKTRGTVGQQQQQQMKKKAVTRHQQTRRRIRRR